MAGITVTASIARRDYELIEDLVANGEFNNRSDAIREIIREWARKRHSETEGER